MFCPNCGTEIDNNSVFCTNCGANIGEENNEQPQDAVQEVEAQEVAQEVEAQEAVAEEVAEATETVEESAAEQNFTAETYEDAEKSGSLKKIIIAAVSVVAVLLVAFGAWKIVGSIFNSSDEVDYSKFPVVYVKDDEINLLPHGKKEAYELTDEGDISDVEFTKDGKTVFYPGSVSDDGTYDLYYKKAGSEKAEGKKIASDVSYYMLIPDTTNILYVSDGDLFFSDLKKETKLAKDVSSWDVDEDFKKLVYTDDDNDLYITNIANKAKSEKLDKDVTGIVYGATNFDTIYYVKDDGDVYMKKGKKSEKIGSGYYDLQIAAGKLYAIKEETNKYKFADLVEDDLTAKLGVNEYMHLKRPSYYSENYEDEYDEWWDNLYDDYRDLDYDIREALDTCTEIDGLKLRLDKEPIEKTSYSLYVYEKNDFKKLDSNLSEGWVNYIGAEDDKNSIVYYTKGEEGKVKKVKLSDYEDELYSVYSEVAYGSSESEKNTFCIVKDGKVITGPTTKDSITDMDLSENGKYIYLFTSKMDEETYQTKGDLVRYTIGSKELGGEKEILSGISGYMYYEDNFIVARKYKKDDKKELVGYIKGKEVEISDDNVGSYDYVDGEFYYLNDVDEESGEGELLRYNGGKAVTVAEDVSDWSVYGDSKIVFIRDWEPGEGGELCITNSKGKKVQVVDDEVTGFIEY